MDGVPPPLRSKRRAKPSQRVLDAEEQQAEKEQDRVERALERRRRDKRKQSSKQDDTPSKRATVPADASTIRYLEDAENQSPPGGTPSNVIESGAISSSGGGAAPDSSFKNNA